MPSNTLTYSSTFDRICNFVNVKGACFVTVNSSLGNITTPNGSYFVIDTSIPYVVQILLHSNSTPNATYAGGESLMLDVHFSRAVVVSLFYLPFSDRLELMIQTTST